MYTIRFKNLGATHTLQASRTTCHTAARAIALGLRGTVVSVWRGEMCTHTYSFPGSPETLLAGIGCKRAPLKAACRMP